MHVKCALHAVLPNAETMRVLFDLQCGQSSTLPPPVKKARSALLP